MGDPFFTKEKCDRCGGDLSGGRIMSMYNEDCICMECKAKERQRADYAEAQRIELEQVKQGNTNFPGIGYKEDNQMGGRGGGSGRGGGAAGSGASSRQGEEWKGVINQSALRAYTHGFKSTSEPTEAKAFDGEMRALKAEISKNPAKAAEIAQKKYDQSKAEFDNLMNQGAREAGGFKAIQEKRSVAYGKMRAAEFLIWSVKGGN